MYRIRCLPVVALLAATITPAKADADEIAPGANPVKDAPRRIWTVAFQGGFASTFQLTLGGMFGQGPDWQNRMTAGVSNIWRDGDTLSFYGWSTTDLPTSTANWQAGVSYKNRLFHTKRQSLALGGGLQRWLFPSVKTGAKDWVVAGNLDYATSLKRLPLKVSQESWSLLSSTLPKGSLVYTQVNAQHTLYHREHFQVALRHGPHHTYSWGFYGTNGNRVMRYGATLVVVWNGTTFEGGCRQQVGLQDGIRDNRFWTFTVTRQFSGPFGLVH